MPLMLDKVDSDAEDEKDKEDQKGELPLVDDASPWIRDGLLWVGKGSCIDMKW